MCMLVLVTVLCTHVLIVCNTHNTFSSVRASLLMVTHRHVHINIRDTHQEQHKHVLVHGGA